MAERVIDEDTWLAEFAPDSELYETYGDDLQKISKMPNNFVWTLIDSDEGNPLIVNGMRFVNRIGYYLGKLPHNPKDLIVVQVQ